MKRVSLFITTVSAIAISLLTACNNAADTNTTDAGGSETTAYSADLTTAVFTDSVQNFGTVQRGEQVKILFHVRNTGTKPLLIENARPSCGCTVADFTKSPIAPGGQGEIKGTFDSNHGSPGQIRKTITVSTNTMPANNVLVFTGEVESDK